METTLHEASAVLNGLCGCVPVLYGSFALEKVIGRVFPAHDIDLLIPRQLLDQPSEIIEAFARSGFRHIPAEVLTFSKNDVLVELADWNRWSQTCGFVWERTILEETPSGSYRRLCLEDLQNLYRYLAADSQRKPEKRDRDRKKLHALKIQSLVLDSSARGFVLPWLLDGDPSVQYHTRRFLLDETAKETFSIHQRISTEGWGADLLSRQNPDGHWGLSFYQPKWTSTHYSLTDLKDLGLDRTCLPCARMVDWIFANLAIEGGGINCAISRVADDLCVDGMILAYAVRFSPDNPRLGDLARHILANQKTDGGFSWDENAAGGDPHTTICVLEGFSAFRRLESPVWNQDFSQAMDRAVNFFFTHRLFMGEDPRFSRLAFPYRYRYDLLRFLDFYSKEERPFDARLKPAIDWLKHKQRSDGRSNLELIHPGNVHSQWEKPREPSRILTMKALFVLSRLDQ